ncbi:hypothetical protein F5Y02DRAFT_423314 [Annulohypoxylon stygium]|nr:hypothetical protein F5Y02DRAFT_423314 [Annulohypoxylon stygium]
MAYPKQELTPAAQYGNMPFDMFLMERWDRVADPRQDKEQWDELARQYLAMKPKEREPYHKEASQRWQQIRQHMSSNNAVITEAKVSDDIVMARVLPSMQTIQERNFCARRLTHTYHEPALVRTYYGPVNGESRDEPFRAMARDFVLQGCVEKDGIWDDRTLYDVGDDWHRIVLRVPGLGDEEVRRDVPPSANDRDELDLWLLEKRLATQLYVVDREAMEQGMIKVFYLDPHGNAAWSHKFKVEVMLEYNGAWQEMGLADINGCFSETREDGSELLI